MRLILASASPRRKELMGLLPWAFEVYVPNFDEKNYEETRLKPQALDLEKHLMALAKAKGMAALNELAFKNMEESFYILSADTMVILEEEALGKGENRTQSIEMLKKLNGKKHQVKTAVCLLGQGLETAFVTTTEVYFAESSLELITQYVDRYRPFDKAGAYGIQDGGILLVEKIEGSYPNVMGLPIREVYEMLLKTLEVPKLFG